MKVNINQIKYSIQKRYVISFYRDMIEFGSPNELKQHKEMLFLGDSNFDAANWIDESIKLYESDDAFILFREEDLNLRLKCVAVKAYRILKKAKEVITPEKIFDKMTNMM